MLPEQQNGLGYQNLISIVFTLMRYRDEWLRIGKAKSELSTDNKIEPIHLVLLEEPEAHLHVQVQQVFIQQAYNVLTNFTAEEATHNLQTQLLISTHSSHMDLAFSMYCKMYCKFYSISPILVDAC